MPELKRYNIFISHAWRYGEEYDRLINLLDNAPMFRYYNYSAPQEKPLLDLDATNARTQSEIANAINRKIISCSCVLVISGMYAAYRDWMQYEINTAVRMQKYIIGIVPWGQQRIPDNVKSVADVMVGWNTSSIVDAIKKYGA